MCGSMKSQLYPDVYTGKGCRQKWDYKELERYGHSDPPSHPFPSPIPTTKSREEEKRRHEGKEDDGASSSPNWDLYPGALREVTNHGSPSQLQELYKMEHDV